MSDPMTNTEVEDVLASIRRLVSDDNRPEPKPVENAVTDRLVLTPSLRVMDNDNLGAPDADMLSAAVSQDTPTQLNAADLSDESTVKDLTGNVNPEEDVAESPLQDATPQVEAVSDAPAAKEDGANTHEPLFSNDENDWDEAQVTDVPTEFDSAGLHAIDLEETESPDNSDVQDIPSMSDGEPDAQAEVGLEPVVKDLNDTVVADDFAIEDAPFATDVGDETVSNVAARTLSEKVAALETLVGKRGDNFEPDDLNVGANAGSEPPAMEWEDVDPISDEAQTAPDTVLEAEPIDVDPNPTTSASFADAFIDGAQSDAGASVDDAPAYAAFVGSRAKATPEDDDAPMFSDEEDVLDEETLRELVSEIVREELQGALGERITRNVRKLVRREIHRAMAAQDLD
ncbi:hypothetical protein [Tateyamaria sp.]|uniref:hypothetical protein n=1 Tax=Tateyamaria sp. TaxID=1929288 RepID=UPI00329F1C04